MPCVGQRGVLIRLKQRICQPVACWLCWVWAGREQGRCLLYLCGRLWSCRLLLCGGLSSRLRLGSGCHDALCRGPELVCSQGLQAGHGRAGLPEVRVPCHPELRLHCLTARQRVHQQREAQQHADSHAPASAQPQRPAAALTGPGRAWAARCAGTRSAAGATSSPRRPGPGTAPAAADRW